MSALAAALFVTADKAQASELARLIAPAAQPRLGLQAARIGAEGGTLFLDEIGDITSAVTNQAAEPCTTSSKSTSSGSR